METIIRIYDRERLLEAKLQSGETCTIGKAAGCTIQLAAACLGKKTITVKTDADSWSVAGAGFRQEKLPYEKSLVLDPDAHLALTAYPCRTKAAVPVPLTGTERLTIGRNADCDIQIADQQISGKHTALFYQDGRWRFQDLKSRNGTYWNMCLAGSGVLADGDVLSIGFCQLRVSGDRLFVWSSKAVRVKPAAAPEKRTAVSPDDPYPFCFKPSPRLLEETPCKTLELQAPPTIGGKPNVSWLNILLAPLLSVIVMVAVCLLVTNVMTMLYFSVPTTIIGVVVSILRYRGEKKKYRSQQQLRLDTYSTYLQEQVRELEALRSGPVPYTLLQSEYHEYCPINSFACFYPVQTTHHPIKVQAYLLSSALPARFLPVLTITQLFSAVPAIRTSGYPALHSGNRYHLCAVRQKYSSSEDLCRGSSSKLLPVNVRLFPIHMTDRFVPFHRSGDNDYLK